MKPLVLCVLVLCACQRATVHSIPDPLPEDLAWKTQASAGDEAFLGLETRENDSGSLDDLFFDPGVRVTRVVENSPAQAAGFAVDDIVLAFAGEEIFDPASLDALVARGSGGEKVEIEVRRGDTVRAVEVVLQARGGAAPSETRKLYLVDASRSRAGWATDRDGVRLVSAQANGPFGEFALGTLVTAIDGKAVQSDRGLIKQLESLEPGQKVRITYLDDGESRERTIRLIDVPTKVTGTSVPILFNYSSEADGSETKFHLVDLWLISLFSYKRQENERTWSLLSLFDFSVGEGELVR